MTLFRGEFRYKSFVMVAFSSQQDGFNVVHFVLQEHDKAEPGRGQSKVLSVIVLNMDPDEYAII
jgi:hypothetical protein